ncbi:MAG: sodium:solute symporter family protein, partial [Clostridia bacterium]|nr:sodium:solute symporter family protein [Clostridia bacterium]
MEPMLIVWITIGVYAALMLFFGFLAGKKNDSVAGLTVGKRNAGAWLTAMSYGCAYFSAVMFIGYSGASGWNYGLWAVLVGLGNAIIGSLFAWKVLAKRTRTISHHYHIKSMPQMFDKRFESSRMRVFSSIVIFIFLLPYSASVYKGLASVCSVMLGMDDTLCMIIIAALSALLLVFGGYLATIKADFIQGILIFIGVCLLIFFVLRSDTVVAGGGIKGLIDKMRETGVSPLSAKSAVALAATVLMTSFGTWGLPQMIHKYYGIKDEHEIKRGTIISTVFAFVVAGGGYFIGGFSRMFFTNEQFNSIGGADYAVPHML